MTRGEVLAPLKAGEGRFNMTAGLVIRGAVRRGALQYGIDYYEEKGWLDSVFVFRGPADRVFSFKNILEATFID